MTSIQSEEELFKFIQETKELLPSAWLDLYGWEHFALQKSTKSSEPIPILGLLWDKDEDVLLCDMKTLVEHNQSIMRKENFVNSPQDFRSNCVFMSSDWGTFVNNCVKVISKPDYEEGMGKCPR